MGFVSLFCVKRSLSNGGGYKSIAQIGSVAAAGTVGLRKKICYFFLIGIK